MTIGVYEKQEPIQEQMILSKIAWIMLNRTYLVNGIVPLEQLIKIPTIKINIKYTFAS